VIRSKMMGECKCFCIVVERDMSPDMVFEALVDQVKPQELYCNYIFQNEVQCCGRRVSRESKLSSYVYTRDQVLELTFSCRGGMRTFCVPFARSPEMNQLREEKLRLIEKVDALESEVQRLQAEMQASKKAAAPSTERGVKISY
jgi:outer membrane murein-binding lipoprotein Lpp